MDLSGSLSPEEEYRRHCVIWHVHDPPINDVHPITGPPDDPEALYREDLWLAGNAGEEFNRMMESRLRAETAAGLYPDEDPFA